MAMIGLTASGENLVPADVGLLGVKTQLLQTTVNLAGGGANAPGLSAPPPAGFNWPFNTYPVSFAWNGTGYTSTFNARSYATAAFAGTKYFVNGSTGSDANNGLTLGTAVKSIWKATQLGNATAAPFNVSVAQIAGGYPRENGFSNVSTATPNTQPAAYVATGAVLPAAGGICDCWVGSTLTWSGTPDPTFTTLYTATRGLASQVINPTILDANGDPILAPTFATAALANAATGSAFFTDGTTCYVKWVGGAAVTNTNTRVLLKSTPNFVTNATSKDVYLEGFNFQGGSAAAVACTAAATMNLIAVNCFAGYAGDAATNVNTWKLDFITGLAALVNCVGSNAEADGINSHWTPGGVPGLFTYTQNCIGRNNGRDTVQSCNGLTSHDDVISIDVNGLYFGNFGGNLVPINNCQTWALGTYCHDSLGDISHGGTIPPTDYNTQFTAQLWLQNCRSAVSTTSLNAASGTFIRTRNFSQGPGQSTTGGGTITTF